MRFPGRLPHLVRPDGETGQKSRLRLLQSFDRLAAWLGALAGERRGKKAWEERGVGTEAGIVRRDISAGACGYPAGTE